MKRRTFAQRASRSQIIVAVVLAFAPATVVHATKFWKNSVTNGFWNTGNNWSALSAAGVDNGGVPASSEPVRIVHTDGVARTVTLDTNPPSLGLTAIDLTGAGATTDTLLVPNNNNLTVGAIAIGGYNGTAETNGRGTLTQSNGTLTTSAGTDLVVAWGAGSTGIYTLSGGNLVASQSEFIGNKGAGTFSHTSGTNTILLNGIGSFFVGQLAGSNGAYNLSGTGQLISNESEYIGNLGTGTFTQTGGTNTINGAKDLILGFNAGGSGTYAISAGTLTANNNVVVGSSGVGTLNISGTGNVSIANNLTIGPTSNVNLSGGTLRLNSTNAPSRINFSSGKLQLGGSRTIGTDSIVSAQFGANPVITNGKELAIDGDISVAATLTVNGGKLSTVTGSGGNLTIGSSGTRTLSVTNGGTVFISNNTLISSGSTINIDGPGSTFTNNLAEVDVGGSNSNGFINISGGGAMVAGAGAQIGGTSPGFTGQGFVTVTGPGSSLTCGLYLWVGGDAAGTLTIQDNSLVSAGTSGLQVFNGGIVNLNGGTLRTSDIAVSGTGKLAFNSGTILFTGNKSIGSDSAITTYYGALPVLQAGKGLGVEGTATLLTPVSIDGGTFSVGQLVNGNNLTMNRGKLNITNQVLTIGSGGALGSTLDLNDDMTVNVTLGTTNQGLITGGGEIGGSFANAATGELRGEPGKSLKLTGANNTNAGQINLYGGLVEFTQSLTNNVGAFISGNGTIKTNLLTNSGTMNFSGLANIVGDVTNSAGGKIISSGGGPTTFHDDVINNGEIRTSAGSFTTFFGATSGSGTYTGTGTVNFEGDLKPGNSPAAISFAGNMALGVDSALKMELGGLTGGSQYDQVAVAGNLALDGALQISLIDGFTPAAGNSFNLLDWGSRSGTFSAISLPTLSGLIWDTSQLYTTGVLSVASASLPGDFNNDGAVNAADYVVWRKGLGTIYSQGDYNVWRSNFGAPPGSGDSISSVDSAVPEPRLLPMLAFAAAGMFRLRRDWALA